jgi:acyl-homoserine lactone acylase PvdQ
MAWDATMAVSSETATLFAALTRQLSTLASAETHADWWFDVGYLYQALTAGDANCPAPAAGGCAAFVGAALDAVAAENGITTADGATDGDTPLWGTLGAHQAEFVHQLLGGSPLACLADRTIAHGGDACTVNVGPFSFDADDDFAQTAGPSYRQVVDLSALDDGSAFVNPMGQDGNTFSPGYDNLLLDWAFGSYLQMVSDPATVASWVEDVTVQTLHPPN